MAQGNRIERALEHLLLGSRWLLAPLYVALVACFGLIYVTFARKAFSIARAALESDISDLILSVLSLIDLVLMGNLLLLVILAGYEGAVSRISVAGERLTWMGRVNFGTLKLKLVASIVAISTVHLLEDFLHVGALADRDLAWQLALHGAFVASGVLLALMDRLAHTDSHDASPGEREDVTFAAPPGEDAPRSRGAWSPPPHGR